MHFPAAEQEESSPFICMLSPATNCLLLTPWGKDATLF
jgi:hypothetical protein